MIDNIGLSLFLIGFLILILAALMASEAGKPAAKYDEPIRKPDTTRQCLLCGRVVSLRKITGDLCTLCHVKTVPVPKSPATKNEPVTAIKAEVKDND